MPFSFFVFFFEMFMLWLRQIDLTMVAIEKPSTCAFLIRNILLFFSNEWRQPGEPIAQSSPLTNASNNNSYQNGNGYYQDANKTTTESDNNGERGRQRKKRDFFGTLKRRLGRSKSRAKSIDRSMIPIDADNPNGELRSVSADRMPSGTLGNNIGGGITSNTSTGNYLWFHFCFRVFFPIFFSPTF